MFYKGIEKQQSHQLFHFYVYSSYKEQSFSDTFRSFQKRSVPILSKVIVDTLMSVWRSDCHQTEEEHLQQPEQAQNQHSFKSSLTRVWSVLLRHFSPTPSIIFSHRKDQYEWVSDSLGSLSKWLPMLVAQIRNLTQRSCGRTALPFPLTVDQFAHALN